MMVPKILELANTACTRSPAAYPGAMVVGASRARFQAVCVAWGWFRQSGAILSYPPVPLKGHNASRWAAVNWIGGKLKTQTTITLLAIIMFSCVASVTSTASPDVMPVLSTRALSETAIPTLLSTSTFTPIPATELPLPTQTAVALITPEPISFLNPTKTKVFVIGITNEGELNYSLGDGTPFRILYEPEGGFTSVRFLMILSSRLKELTIPQITTLASGWQILIYCYRTDETYSNSNQPALILNNLQAEMHIDAPYLIVDVNRQELLSRFGDCRALTFQLVDEKGNLEQGNFVLNPNSEGGPIAADGGLIGYPYSIHENETVFFREGEFITVQEPRGGFYRLYYMFNFVRATGVTATIEQEALANELTINLFPYQSDGDYSASVSYPVIGEIRSTVGVYTVDLPIDSLKENVNGDNMYYLQIVDDKGNTIQDENFIFVPYTP